MLQTLDEDEAVKPAPTRSAKRKQRIGCGHVADERDCRRCCASPSPVEGARFSARRGDARLRPPLAVRPSGRPHRGVYRWPALPAAGAPRRDAARCRHARRLPQPASRSIAAAGCGGLADRLVRRPRERAVADQAHLPGRPAGDPASIAQAEALCSLSVGVSKHNEKASELRLPPKDATDFARALEAQRAA